MRAKRNFFLLLSVAVLSVIAACGVSIISTYNISGTVTQNGSGLSGVNVSLTGTSSASATTDANGNYSFAHVANGNYIITPSFSGYVFSPSSSSQTVNGANISGVNFTTSGSTAVVKTLAGSGTSGFSDGTGNLASFNSPGGITTDGTNLYVTDTGNNAIREIGITTGQVLTLAGFSGTPGFTNGAYNAAAFKSPNGIAISPNVTNLYVVDTLNFTIRDLSAGQVTTLTAGTGTPGFTDGAGNAAYFRSPNGVTISPDGTTLYVADTGNNAIRKIVIASGQVITLAGSGTPGFANGAGNVASFSSPNGITISPDGTNLYVADTGNYAIRQIVIASGQVTTLAGSGTPGFADGATNAAYFSSPNGIATDGTNLYVADTGNHRIRQVVIASGLVTTLAGSGTAAIADGIGTAASFDAPLAITITGTNLYVTDSNAIRSIQLQ